MKRILARLAVAIVAMSTVGMVASAPAQAATDDYSYFNGAYATSCLDSNTAKKVYLTANCNSNSFQRWIFNTANSNLRNKATGFCLDSNASGSVYTGGCNAGNFQKWRRAVNQLVNVATGLCLDVDANKKVYTHACNTGSRQLWLRAIRPS